jgi:hypothetical protein
MNNSLIKENKVIIENNKKYDIVEAIRIQNNVTIYFAGKRLFNFFKNDHVSNSDLIDFLKFDIVIKSYFMNKANLNQVNKLLNYITKSYHVFGDINNELVDKEKFDEFLEGYAVFLKLTN